MSFLSPSFTGTLEIRSATPAFFEALKARVQLGLLTGKPHPRARYAVTKHTERELAIRASDFLTAINVGLNDVVLQSAADRQLDYSVGYSRWAAYVVGLSAVIGAAVALAHLGFKLGGGSHLDADQTDSIFWALVLFWGGVWPWILVAMHRRFARGLLVRILREVDVAARSR